MNDRSPEEHEEQQTGSDNLIKRLYRPGPLVVLFTLAFIGLVGLAVYLLNHEPPPPQQVVTALAAPSEQVPTTDSDPAPRVYEEDSSSTVEDMVKEADLAIIESMRDRGLDLHQLDLLDVEIRRLNGHGYHYQVLQLPSVKDLESFLAILNERLAVRLPEAALTTAAKKNEIDLAINGLQTHRLLFKAVPLTLPRPEKKGPKLAIVIDDIGENMRVLDGLLDLPFPVTLAVWPHASSTRTSVERIKRKQREIIIHFPMEPRGYPRYNPGKDALFVSMTADEMRRQIAENLAQVPEATGTNNHMGSRFTGYGPGMKVALEEFKKHGLFFLDSLTTSKSVARSTARNAGIPFYERDIFIDNVKDVPAIIHQLKKAENVALKKGYSIAIGHPYRETLSALQQWNKRRNTSIRLISLSELAPQ